MRCIGAKMTDLEQEIEKEKISWKQWLPMGIGIYFAFKDALNQKPYLMDPKHPARLYGSAFYHSLVSAYPLYLGAKDLIENGF